MTTSVQKLARDLMRLTDQVNGLATTPRLANSSIENGSLDAYDANGQLVMALGQQWDGTYVAQSLSGPKPPMPSTPTLTAGPISLIATWDGVWMSTFGVPDPMGYAPQDFTRIEVHVSEEPEFNPEGAATIRGTIETPRGADCIVTPLRTQPQYVRFVARTLSGRASDPSPAAVITPLDAVDTVELKAHLARVDEDIAEANRLLGENAEELARAKASLATASGNITTAQGDLDKAFGRITAAENVLGTIPTQISEANKVVLDQVADLAATAGSGTAGHWLYSWFPQKGTGTTPAPSPTDFMRSNPTREIVPDSATLAGTPTDGKDVFAGMYRALVRVDTERTLHITGTHDDAGAIYVDGLQKYRTDIYSNTAAATITLSPGWHVIDLTFYDNYGGQGWTLRSGAIGAMVDALVAPSVAGSAQWDAVIAETNAAAYAESLTSAAEQAAITAAAADAKAQAEAAEARAATAAAADAKAKADAAQSAALAAAKTYADAQASGAGTTALNAAKADATAKADAAKQAAITAAAADATAKKEQAEATAAADAKAKADAALTAAKADATTKADAAKAAAITAAAADAKAKTEAAEARVATAAAADAKAKADAAQAAALAAAKTYADAQASGASSTALDAAKADATAKADAAKAAAITAAAADATAKKEQAEATAAADAKAKADAALAAAKTDATSKADAALAAAKADATSKADAAKQAAIMDAQTGNGYAGQWLMSTLQVPAGRTAPPAPEEMAVPGVVRSFVPDRADLAKNLGTNYMGSLRTLVRVTEAKSLNFTASHDDAGAIYLDGVRVFYWAGVSTAKAFTIPLTPGWHVLELTWNEITGNDGWFGIAPLIGSIVDQMSAPSVAHAAQWDAAMVQVAAAADATAKADAAKAAAITAAKADAKAQTEAAEARVATAAAADAKAKADAAQTAALAAAKTYADAQASGAGTAALDAAKADATSKADAAKAAAITAAAADATAKKEQAEANAAADAKAKADAALAAAKTDATSKASAAQTAAIAAAKTETTNQVTVINNAILGQVYAGTAIPTNTSPAGARIGSTYRRRDANGVIIAEYEWTGAGGWVQRKLSGASLTALDVGTLTAGDAAIDTAVAKKLAAAQATFTTADVGNLTVTGTSTLAKAVVDKLYSDVVMSRKIVAEQLLVGSPSNLIPDPMFLDDAMLARRNANSTVTVTRSTAGDLALAAAGTGNTYFRPTGIPQTPEAAAQWISVTPGEVYAFTASFVGVKGATNDLRFTGRTKDGLTTVPVYKQGSTTVTTENFAAGDGTYTITAVVPANCYWLLPEVRLSGTAGTCWITKGTMTMKQLITESLIVEEGITAKNIKASEELWAKLGKFVKVEAEQIGTYALDGRVITGTTVRTAPSGARIELSGAASGQVARLFATRGNGSEYFSVDEVNGVVVEGELVSRGVINSFGGEQPVTAKLGTTTYKSTFDTSTFRRPALSFERPQAPIKAGEEPASITTYDGESITIVGANRTLSNPASIAVGSTGSIDLYAPQGIAVRGGQHMLMERTKRFGFFGDRAGETYTYEGGFAQFGVQNVSVPNAKVWGPGQPPLNTVGTFHDGFCSWSSNDHVYIRQSGIYSVSHTMQIVGGTASGRSFAGLEVTNQGQWITASRVSIPGGDGEDVVTCSETMRLDAGTVIRFVYFKNSASTTIKSQGRIFRHLGIW